jgi:hypothetical protein
VSSLTDTCDSPGTSGGTCTVTFTSLTPGTVTGHAAMTIPVSGLAISRETDGIAPNSDDAVKTFIQGALTWQKIEIVDGIEMPLGGATFEVCRTQSWTTTGGFEPLTTPECRTVTDAIGSPSPSSLGDQDPRAGFFELSGLSLGLWTILETAAPAGYIASASLQSVQVTTGTPSPSAGVPFVNMPEEDKSGCTPGFWKNHTELWDQTSDEIASAAGFTTSTSFNTYFGLTPSQSGFSNSFTMDDAINAGGGDGNKLARHGVAALLNLSTEYAYDYPGDLNSLKAEIKQAYIDDDYEPLASDLASANEYGCLVETN